MGQKRLAKLKRQRTLLQEHLDWLEEQILEELGEPLPPRQGLQQEAPHAKVEAPKADEHEALPASQVASELYSELGPDAAGASAAAKKGCIYSFAILAICTLGLFAWVLLAY